MKKIGFLSFGHHRDVPGARVPSAAQTLRDHIEFAKVADELGVDYNAHWMGNLVALAKELGWK